MGEFLARDTYYVPGEEPVSRSTRAGRSEKLAAAEEANRVRQRLVDCGEAELAHVPISDELRTALELYRRITAHGGRRRQGLLVDKLLRSEDLDAIEAVLDCATGDARAAQLQELERWRRRLIDEGDPAIQEFLTAHPSGDRPQLRALARQAAADTPAGRAALQKLFQALRAAADL